MRSIALILLGVALSAVAGLVALRHFYTPPGLELEVGKALLNVLTVAVVAQAVAFMIALHNEARRREGEADQLRLRTLGVLNQAYTAVKRTRRRARARSKRSASGAPLSRSVSRALYFTSLEQLNDAQLKLELLAKDVETYASLFEDGATIYSSVSAMEEYLNDLVNEWEHLAVPFTGQPPEVNVSEVSRFADLIGDYQSSRFRPLFVHNYHAAIERLRASLVTSTSENWKKRRTWVATRSAARNVAAR